MANLFVQRLNTKVGQGIGSTVNAPVPSSVNSKLTTISEESFVSREKRNKIEYQRISLVEGLPELRIVASIESVYSEETIRRIAVTEIDNPDISNPRSSQPRSLYDPLMGTVVADRACTTCQNVNCLGHYGRISLEYPLPHPLWIVTIVKLLTSVCNSCGHLLMDKKKIRHMGLDRLSNWKRIETIAAMSENIKTCSYARKCPDINDGTISPCLPNPGFKESNQEDSYHISKIIKTDSDKITINMEITDILGILKSIPDEDAMLLGFKEESRPENLIMQSLLVMPPISRPPFIADGRNNPDDLTEQYRRIIICANELRLNPTDEGLRSKVFVEIKNLMIGRKQKYKTKVPQMAISSQLQGKKAVPRNSLMGKRTNMCARTVISPDTSLEFGQIRVPEEWAANLNIPEIVRTDNIERLQGEVERGKITEIHTYNETYRVYQNKPIKKDTKLKLGDKAWRHLRNGDTVALNRQPTLHKFSMMAFEVVLSKERTLGIHFAYTTVFGADFDGDEMNLWVPVSHEAITEAKEILHVSKNIMNPAKNKINMALVYDCITSSHLLTRKKLVSTFLADELLDLTTRSEDYASLPERLRKHKIPPLSGKGVFSALLPYDLDYTKGDLIIRDGVLIAGSLTADHVAPKSRTILEKIFMEYGGERYADFITNTSFMLFKFIEQEGHTISIADCMAIDNEKRQMEIKENENALQNIQSQIDAIPEVLEDDDILINLREQQIRNIIQASGELGFRSLKEEVKKPENNLGVMLEGVGSGAKGKIMNLQQMRGRLGQQYRKGERLPVNCNGRILPGFDYNDPDIRSRGYVKSNFTQGLTPEEFFLHMMASREQLIDIAVNVPIVGDIHRKLVKALENLLVDYTGSVTNTSKACFMLLYGGDGFTGDKLILVKPPYSNSGPVPMFFDPFDLATDLNIQAGWTSQKDQKLAGLKRYVLDLDVTVYLEDNTTVELCNMPIANRRNFTDTLLEAMKFQDELLQQVEIPSERKTVISDKGTEIVTDECIESIRLYYDVSSSDGSLSESKERYDVETEYQIDMIRSMRSITINVVIESEEEDRIVRSMRVDIRDVRLSDS